MGIMSTYREIKQGVKNLVYWAPVVFRDRHWDNEFLEEILLHKLRAMEAHFKDEDIYLADATRLTILYDIQAVIEALERLTSKEDVYSSIPEDKTPELVFTSSDESNLAHSHLEYKEGYGKDVIQADYEALVQKEIADRQFVYEMLRDKSKSWWD